MSAAYIKVTLGRQDKGFFGRNIPFDPASVFKVKSLGSIFPFMKKILLIEDNQDHSDLIIRSLTEGLGNVKIHQANRCKEAFKLMDERQFDLILSDYYLPDSRGEAHIQRLVKKAPETPIIIITGQGDEKTAARSIKAGADDYIVKTRDSLKALPRILNRAFAKHQTQLKKRKREFKKQLRVQEEAMRKILDEVEVLEKKITRLNRLSKRETKTDSKSTALNALIQQVGQLKHFVQKVFSSGK
jgi:DNA-binding NtrC family response regulator